MGVQRALSVIGVSLGRTGSARPACLPGPASRGLPAAGAPVTGPDRP